MCWKCASAFIANRVINSVFFYYFAAKTISCPIKLKVKIENYDREVISFDDQLKKLRGIFLLINNDLETLE